MKSILKKDLVGKQFKIVKGGSGIALGTIVTISNTNIAHFTDNTEIKSQGLRAEGYPNSTIYLGELECFTQTAKYVKELIEKYDSQITELQEKIKFEKVKLQFMKDNKIKEFDHTQFKVYSILKELNTNASDIEKAKIISKLINS